MPFWRHKTAKFVNHTLGERLEKSMYKITERIGLATSKFVKSEDGLALTEYLVLLGLMVGAVATSILIFGTTLAEIWTAWAGYFAAIEKV